MHTHELTRQRAILKGLIRRASHETSLHDEEMRAHWAKYLCILTAGFVENSMRLTFSAFAETNASPTVHRYVESRLERIQNPKTEAIAQLLGSFDSAWRKSFEVFAVDNNRKDAIDSIMANRNQIAHGRYSGITIARVDQYLMRIVEVVEYIEGKLGI